jgi:hypothetical protein
MQTFLPYPDFQKSVQTLDWRRLGKQRVEAMQILNVLLGSRKNGWRNHPIVKMWTGYEDALCLYMNHCIEEWVGRGYKNTMQFVATPVEIEYPKWFGDKEFHASHRSNLLRKDYKYYSQFGWKEPTNLPYKWN